MFTVGIDTHSRTHSVCVLDEHGTTMREFTVKGGVDELIGALRDRVPGRFRACYEASLGYGVLHDALAPVAAQVAVAHPGRLRLISKAKHKNDRVDARKLARLMYLDELPEIHIPEPQIREWRVLISHRGRLVDKRTAAKNGLRAVLRGHGIHAPRGASLWTKAGRVWCASLELDSPLAALRRDQLLAEIAYLDAMVQATEKTLGRIAAKHPGVMLLRTIKGIGARTAEAIVAWIDRPERFTSTRRAASYFGLVPSLDESGSRSRQGRITKTGPALVRKLVVEASWRVIALNAEFRALFERVKGGKKDRTGRALVAVAHRLVRVMAAMLKSAEPWRAPAALHEARTAA